MLRGKIKWKNVEDFICKLLRCKYVLWRKVFLPCRWSVQVGDRAEVSGSLWIHTSVETQKWVWHLRAEIGGKLQGNGKVLQKKTKLIQIGQ